MTSLVVDTHALLWYLSGDRKLSGKLSKAAEKNLDRDDVRIVVSTIVLAELKYLTRHGRIDTSFDEILDLLNRDPRFLIFPFDLNGVEQMPDLDLHDGMIVSAALCLRQRLPETEVLIVSRDEKIKERYPHLIVW